MSATLIHPADQLTRLVDGVRSAVDVHADWSRTARLVADELREHLPGPDILTAEQRLGSPDGYRGHTLHAAPDGAFSIIALVWRPGQLTRIHDHTTWCVFGVIQGVEHEELFDADLHPIGSSDNYAGDVSGFAPPGDIHRVHNTGAEVAISVHIYGTDVTRIGSSARRIYDLPDGAQPSGAPSANYQAEPAAAGTCRLASLPVEPLRPSVGRSRREGAR